MLRSPIALLFTFLLGHAIIVAQPFTPAGADTIIEARETVEAAQKADVAYTNADFNYLRGVQSLVTETHDFSYFAGIGDATRADNPYTAETIPPASAFSPARSEYIIAVRDPRDPEAFAGITALLAHCDANLPQLKIEHPRREALSAARKRYDTKHPKEPEPFISSSGCRSLPNRVSHRA